MRQTSDEPFENRVTKKTECNTCMWCLYLEDKRLFCYYNDRTTSEFNTCSAYTGECCPDELLENWLKLLNLLIIENELPNEMRKRIFKCKQEYYIKKFRNDV